jgi:hypothetical protein
MKGKLARQPRAEQWADRICMQLGKSVEAIIDVGRLLVKAKGDLAHGEWVRMFENELVPFNRQTAFKLIAIAEHSVISNVSHGKHLPPAWTTLYELTRVEPKRLTAAFKNGSITPDMKRSDVQALMPLVKTTARRAPVQKPTEDPDDLYRTAGSKLYFRIALILSDELDTLSEEERADVLSMLDQTINDLRRTRKQAVGE